MVEVRLHGPLARQFGMVWNLDIASPREAVAAIDANRPGFRKAIGDLADKGMVFRVRSKTHDYDNNDVMTTLGKTNRIDIIPIVQGSSAGIRFVIGAILVVAGLNGFFPQITVPIGISLMLGAVSEWLTPQPKKDDFKNLQSWTLGGPTNTADQGLPVPIIYGEVLTGGYPISAGLSVSRLDAAGATSASVSIGGNLHPSYGTQGNGAVSAVIQVSAGAFNLDDPFTYAWTYTGFSGATVTNEGLTAATLRVKVDVASVADESVVEITGTVTCTVTGYQVGTRGSSGPVTLTPSHSESVSVSFIGPRVSPGGS